MKKVAPFLLLIILFAAAGWYFFTGKPDPVHEPPPVVVVEKSQVEPPRIEPAIKPEQNTESEVIAEDIPEPLPLLIESDGEVTEQLAGVVGADPLAQYLVQDQAISRIVSTINRLTSRQVPPLVNPIKPADDKFLVETEGDQFVMSPGNFSRYDGYVAVLQQASTEDLVGLYQRYYPLFQQAWEENGGEGPFDERLSEVIDDLLATPEVSGPVYLTKPEAVYLYADPELESLTAGQKILIRMGNDNAEIVKQKLKELKYAL